MGAALSCNKPVWYCNAWQLCRTGSAYERRSTESSHPFQPVSSSPRDAAPDKALTKPNLQLDTVAEHTGMLYRRRLRPAAVVQRHNPVGGNIVSFDGSLYLRLHERYVIARAEYTILYVVRTVLSNAQSCQPARLLHHSRPRRAPVLCTKSAHLRPRRALVDPRGRLDFPSYAGLMLARCMQHVRILDCSSDEPVAVQLFELSVLIACNAWNSLYVAIYS